ncbi:hypothetical protein [Kitasatospora sp. NPDC088783]|uniref:hypothetical protein n=1 Tax=Kitasatospora sp. NPDC088783 TaxID=3364077 RepID=UPI0037F9E662
MTASPVLDDLPQLARLVYDARMLRPGAETCADATAIVKEATVDLPPLGAALSDRVQRGLAGQACRRPAAAVDGLRRRSCQKRRELADTARNGLAHALPRGLRGLAGEEQVPTFLAERWTASLSTRPGAFPRAQMLVEG